MAHVHDYWAISRRSLFPAVTVSRTAAIFVADTLTDLEIAVAVFYVLVVLLSASFLPRRGVMIAGAACIALTLPACFEIRRTYEIRHFGKKCS